MEKDDMNSLESVSLNLHQTATIVESVQNYEAAKEDEEEQQIVGEILLRLDRSLKENGIHGTAVAFSKNEYRVTLNALVEQRRRFHDERVPDVIKHLQWFKREA